MGGGAAATQSKRGATRAPWSQPPSAAITPRSGQHPKLREGRWRPTAGPTALPRANARAPCRIDGEGEVKLDRPPATPPTATRYLLYAVKVYNPKARALAPQMSSLGGSTHPQTSRIPRAGRAKRPSTCRMLALRERTDQRPSVDRATRAPQGCQTTSAP